MICPKCQHNNTKVLDSRETNSYKAVRRRRECANCHHRFTTFERAENNKFLVIKKDGTREAYDREKVEKGIWKACEKRKVTEGQITNIINSLEESWGGIGKEVPTKIIGQGIMEALKELDEVAYIRFASVYRQFRDLDSFKKELQKFSKKI
ncbi:transcriptional repressor NrdR [Candidatus Peregrinibacteria bacterium]|nr:transcriptional repressor NrdR [Candidatus Peregrinibacteria bacterium]